MTFVGSENVAFRVMYSVPMYALGPLSGGKW